MHQHVRQSTYKLMTNTQYLSNSGKLALCLMAGGLISMAFAADASSAGAAKPSLQIFKRALAKHGVPAGEALHIGDSLREDVQGASAAGIKAVLLHRQEEAVSGVETIRNLTEVISLVDRR